MLVSIAVSVRPLGSFEDFGALFFVAAYTLFNVLPQKLGTNLLVSCCVLLLVCSWILFLLDIGQFQGPTGVRVSGIYYSPNALYPLVSLFIIVFTIPLQQELEGDDKPQKWASVTAFIVLVALLIATQSRAGLVSICLITLYLAVRTKSFPAKVLLSLTSLFTLCATILRSFYARTDGVVDGSIAGRMSIWLDSYNTFSQRHLFGWGDNAFYLYVGDWSESVLRPVEPKNLYLHFLLEGGLFSLLTFLIAFSFFIRFLAKRGRYDYRFSAIGILSVLFILMAGFADVPVFADVSRLPATVLFACICGLCFRK